MPQPSPFPSASASPSARGEPARDRLRVLFSTSSAPGYMLPPSLSDEQVNCGPDWLNVTAPDGRVRSLPTPIGSYDLAAIAAQLPPEQQPEVVVCLVDAKWRNLPRNLGAFKCPRVLLVADTHHLASPLMGMVRYLAAETFDRVVFLYDRHHAPFFHAAGFQNLHWFPGLTFPHDDAAVQAARTCGTRADRIAFVGQVGPHHPRRERLIEALTARGLPFSAQRLSQLKSPAFYGASLLGFNASLNGDLNLRVFEILASGAALLTDRLAPESGLGQLFGDGRELLTYGSPDELADRAARALAHPAETKAIGAAGARWFDEHFSESRRRAAFRTLAFDGVSAPEFAFSAAEKTRVFFGGDTDRLLQSLVIYEGLQELHCVQETVRVALAPGVSSDVRQILGTLPRIEFSSEATDATADLAVIGRAQAGGLVNAPHVWCWDAREQDFEALARAIAPSGFELASQDVAWFRRTTPITACPAEPGVKHVLLYTDDPESGGVAQCNHAVLCGLVRAGYRVSGMQTQADNRLVKEQRELGVTHRWIGYDTGREFARTLTDATDAIRVFQTDRPDLIVFGDCCPMSNLAARQAALELGIPFVVVVGFVGAYLAKTFAAALGPLARQYAAARAVVAVSAENLQLLRTHFGLSAEAGQVIHNGRPEKYFAPRDEAVRTRLRGELGLPADAVVGFTAARLTTVKRHDLQLEAMAQLAGRGMAPNLHLVWAGEGDQRVALEKQIRRLGLSGRVHLLGHRWDVADWYDAADIFLLPSQLEGMPLAVMEAMAKGLPVVATAVSGIPEELGETGQLLTAPSHDPAGLIAQLAGTLEQWSTQPQLRERIGAAGAARARALFRESLMIERTLQLVRTHVSTPVAPAESRALAVA